MTDLPATRAWAAVRPDGTVVLVSITGREDWCRDLWEKTYNPGYYHVVPVLITIDQDHD